MQSAPDTGYELPEVKQMVLGMQMARSHRTVTWTRVCW